MPLALRAGARGSWVCHVHAVCTMEGGTDSGEYPTKNTKRGDTSAALAHRGHLRSLMTDANAGTDVDGQGFWGEGSKKFH